MLRILIIGSRAPGSLEGAYERSFQQLPDCRVDFFDVDGEGSRFNGFGIIPRLGRRFTSALSHLQVQRRCDRFLSPKRDAYDGILIFKGTQFSRSSLEHYRSYHRNAVWMNLNPDDPFNVRSSGSTNGNIFRSLSFFDVYLIWSRTLVPKLKNNGCRKVEYLPFGFDPDFHRSPGQGPSSNGGPITFIGAWDRERAATLERISDLDLTIFGESWKRAGRTSTLAPKIVTRNLYGRDLCEVVYGSKACLNLLRSQNIGAHNMRTFEIPAMGGLMVTTRSTEQNEYFPEEEASLMFQDGDELRSQLRRVAADPRLSVRLRRRSHSLVQNHSYVERAKQLIRITQSA